MNDTTSKQTKEKPRVGAVKPSLYARALAGWVGLMSRAAWLIMILCIAGTGVLAVYTMRNLGVNTDTNRMLSPELDFRKTYDAYKKSFPYFSDTIIIVIDGSDGDRAADAASALYQRLRQNKKQFRSVFYPEGDEYFKRSGLLYLTYEDLARLSDRLAEAQPLLAALGKDPTLRGLFGVLGTAVENLGRRGDFAPEKRAALERTLNKVSSSIEAGARQGKASQLSWTDILSDSGGVGGDHRRIIVVQPDLSFDTLQPAKTVMKTIRGYAKALKLTPENGVRVRLTGSAAIETEELESVATGAAIAGLISLTLVSILLILGLRSLRLVVAVLITLIAGLLWTAGFATVAVGTLNLLSVAGFVLFIGLGVDFGIHFALRYREAQQKALAASDALRQAAAGVGGALTLSAAAAAVAFYSFIPTDYQGVSELGLIAGTGMFIAFIANFTLLPALLTLMPLRISEKRHIRSSSGGVASEAERYLRSHGRLVAGVALLLGIGSLAFLPEAKFDRNPLNLKDFGTESVSTVRELMKDKSTAFYTITVLAKSRADIDRLAKRLKALPTVSKVRSIADYVPTQQKRKLDIIDDMATLLTPTLENAESEPPTTHLQRLAAVRKFRAKVASALRDKKAADLAPTLRRLMTALDLFLQRRSTSEAAVKDLEANLTRAFPNRLSLLKTSLKARPVKESDLPAAVRQREVSANGEFRITVFPREDVIDNDALRRFVDTVRSVAPNATGAPVVELASADAVVKAFRNASFIAIGLITLFLVVVLRSVVDTALVLAPLVLAAALTAATAVAIGLSFNFANIIVLPLLLGLGVASGIHIVMRARTQQDGALAGTSTPRAVLFSALTTVSSFGSLAISSHRGTASMGELLFIAISFTLLCSLIVLPALMAMVTQSREAQVARIAAKVVKDTDLTEGSGGEPTPKPKSKKRSRRTAKMRREPDPKPPTAADAES